MSELLSYSFVQNGLWAAVLASIACGLIGSYIVIKRLVFISGGIAHAAFGGIGLSLYLGINPLWGLLPFSLLSAFGIGFLSHKHNTHEDAAIGILWAFGMALGILFIGLTPGYVPDLFSYLFGNILTVSFNDLVLMACLDIGIVLIVFGLYKEFLALTFDEEGANVLGLPTRPLFYLLLCLIALTVVILVRIVGIILVMALMTIPASIAKQWTMSLIRMMLFSVVLGFLLSVMGLLISFYYDIPSGATIIIISSISFFVSSFFRKLIFKNS